MSRFDLGPSKMTDMASGFNARTVTLQASRKVQQDGKNAAIVAVAESVGSRTRTISNLG